MTYKRGDVIKFKDLREFEVLLVYPTGYLVAGNDNGFSGDDVKFFREKYLNEAKRRNLISNRGLSQVSSNIEEPQESPPPPTPNRRGRPPKAKP